MSYQYLSYVEQQQQHGKNGAVKSPLQSSRYPVTMHTDKTPMDWVSKLLLYYQYQIETDPTTIYGDGYRQVNTCCNTLSFPIVMEYLRTTHQLPVV